MNQFRCIEKVLNMLNMTGAHTNCDPSTCKIKPNDSNELADHEFYKE